MSYSNKLSQSENTDMIHNKTESDMFNMLTKMSKTVNMSLGVK